MNTNPDGEVKPKHTPQELVQKKVNRMMLKLLRMRYCSHESYELESCIHDSVPAGGSHIDQSLRRRGVKKCKPFQEALGECLGGETHQAELAKEAWAVTSCQQHRDDVDKCKKIRPDCGLEIAETALCGVKFLIGEEERKTL